MMVAGSDHFMNGEYNYFLFRVLFLSCARLLLSEFIQTCFNRRMAGWMNAEMNGRVD
jgi:hypothetical protein